MKIAIIILVVAFLILILYTVQVIKKVTNRLTNYKIDTMISSTKYSEEEIIGHLDYIINEALDEYIIMNITPKDIYYIKGSMENEITKYLQEVVPNRLSKTLMTQLSIVYNDEYLGEYIGRHIYFAVVNYVLDYNMSHKKQEAPAKQPTPQTTTIEF